MKDDIDFQIGDEIVDSNTGHKSVIWDTRGDEMNRAERRRQGKEEVKGTRAISIKYNDVERLKHEAQIEAINVAFTLMMGLPLIVLRDKYGFGTKRLDQFCMHVLKQYSCYNQGYIDLDEIRGILKAETGVSLVVHKDHIEINKEEKKNG